MKLKFEVDLTPEEARTFLGLPDVTPIQKEVLARLQERLVQNLSYLDPQEVLRFWMSGTSRGVDEIRRFFASAAQPREEVEEEDEDEVLDEDEEDEDEEDEDEEE